MTNEKLHIPECYGKEKLILIENSVKASPEMYIWDQKDEGGQASLGLRVAFGQRENSMNERVGGAW